MGLIVSDLVWFGRSIALATGEIEADRGVSAVQIALVAPQAALLNVGMAISSQDEYGYEVIGGLAAPSMVLSALTFHGVYNVLWPDGDMAKQWALASFDGINTVWTTVALSQAAGGEVQMSDIAPWIAITVSPGLAMGIHGTVADTAQRSHWVATTAWSGALFGYSVMAWTGLFDPRRAQPRRAQRSPVRDTANDKDTSAIVVLPMREGDAWGLTATATF